ncbi:MAG: hypothetical protein AB9866_03960 [Syntrophobacteraceae bacterium]
MSTLVTLFGILMATLGMSGIIYPGRILRFARYWDNPTGLYSAAVLRIFVGMVVFLAAPDSRAPVVLHILGIIIFVVGLATPLLGHERAHRILEWWASQGCTFQRLWSGYAMVLGLLLIYVTV